MRVLLLAGTAEARALSHQLAAAPGVELVVSLAGRTSGAAAYGGRVRLGGFGGTAGLERYLRRSGIDALIDATHPFARAISRQAADAADACAIPRLRLTRAPWRPAPGDRWVEVADMAGAARAVARLGATNVLLTVGRRDLAAFTRIDNVRFVVRTIERCDERRFAAAVFIQARGPFSLSEELDLLRGHRIDAVVTKNSGGEDAKLVAARHCGLRVVVVRRPPPVEGTAVEAATEALRWLHGVQTRLRPGRLI